MPAVEEEREDPATASRWLLFDKDEDEKAAKPSCRALVLPVFNVKDALDLVVENSCTLGQDINDSTTGFCRIVVLTLDAANSARRTPLVAILTWERGPATVM